MGTKFNIRNMKYAALTISGTPDTDAVKDVAETGFTATVAGGKPPYTVTINSGSVPTGITGVSGSGTTFTIFAGTPTVAGIYSGIVVRATDARGVFVDLAAFTVTVTPPLGAISASASASRFTGVAPLAVFFDASGTTATSITDYPFHELDYSWNFADAAAGSWSYGNANTNKNIAYGPVAAHVFETAGTYSVVCTVRARDGTTATATVSDIVVSAVANDSATYAISPAGDFTGAPSNATKVSIAGTGGSTVDALCGTWNRILSTYALAGKRVLLRAGETWTLGVNADPTGLGPTVIDKFGSGANPIVQYTATNINALRWANGVEDWRVSNINFVATGFTTNTCLFRQVGAITARNLLLFNCTGTNISTPISLDTDNTHYGENIFICGCTFTPIGHDGTFVQGALNYALLGNRIYDSSSGEHNCRSQGLYKAVISNNSMGLCADGREIISIRGANFPDVEYLDVTQYVLISDNVLGPDSAQANGAAHLAITQGNTRDIIWENNFLTQTRTGMFRTSSGCVGVTFRNNVMKSTTSSATNNSVVMTLGTLAGTDTPDNIWVYNNTFYLPNAPAAMTIVRVDNPIGDLTLQNNLAYAPGATSASKFYNVLAAGSTTSTTNNHNTTDAGIRTTVPGFSVNPPVVLADYAASNVLYNGAGSATVPVVYDILRTLKAASPDIGAVES